MKRIFALISLVLLCFSLASCGIGGTLAPKHTDFIVDYDYGLHREDMATPLLDDSKLFFDPQEWGIDTLVGGDVITLKYTGELLIQETYPSTVVTKHLNIAGISVKKAELLELVVILDENENPALTVKDGSFDKTFTFASETAYIIDEDLSYHELSASDVGKTVWGSYVNSDKTGEIEIISLYSYKPR
ncbi:MAG: hypothetical protein IKB23_05435 [Clostridia bacterium]|nr:hypothetical protein [Clostridia bacterium]